MKLEDTSQDRQLAAKFHRYDHMMHEYRRLFHEMMHEYKVQHGGANWGIVTKAAFPRSPANSENEAYFPTVEMRRVLTHLHELLPELTIEVDPVFWRKFSRISEMKDLLVRMHIILEQIWNFCINWTSKQPSLQQLLARRTSPVAALTGLPGKK